MLHAFITYLETDFLVRALLAGAGIACIAGPLGSIMVWRRMANFGDTLAHATLLGLSLSLWFQINLYYGLFGTSLLVAFMLTVFSRQKLLANDTVLAIMAHTTLAIGLILASLLQQHQGLRVDLLSYLYGDILAVNTTDLGLILLFSVFAFIVIVKIWNAVISLTLQEDLAQIEGVPVHRLKLLIVLLMALVFAVAVKLVGVLLITALFIIPAAAARQMAKSPEQMALWASGIGVLSVCGGIGSSSYWDIPTGPAIVVVSAVLFLGFYLKKLVAR